METLPLCLFPLPTQSTGSQGCGLELGLPWRIWRESVSLGAQERDIGIRRYDNLFLSSLGNWHPHSLVYLYLTGSELDLLWQWEGCQPLKVQGSLGHNVGCKMPLWTGLKGSDRAQATSLDERSSRGVWLSPESRRWVFSWNCVDVLEAHSLWQWSQQQLQSH